MYTIQNFNHGKINLYLHFILLPYSWQNSTEVFWSEAKLTVKTNIELGKKENQVTIKVHLGSCLSVVKSLKNCNPFLHYFLISFNNSFHRYWLTIIYVSGTSLGYWDPSEQNKQTLCSSLELTWIFFSAIQKLIKISSLNSTELKYHMDFPYGSINIISCEKQWGDNKCLLR